MGRAAGVERAHGQPARGRALGRERPAPVAGGREQLRASHVADAADATNVVAVETHDAVAPERNSADDLTLQGEAVAVARRDVEDRPDALLSSESDSGQR